MSRIGHPNAGAQHIRQHQGSGVGMAKENSTHTVDKQNPSEPTDMENLPVIYKVSYYTSQELHLPVIKQLACIIQKNCTILRINVKQYHFMRLV